MTTFVDRSHPEYRETQEEQGATAVAVAGPMTEENSIAPESPEVAAEAASMTPGWKGRQINQRISGHTVNKATADLPDEQRSALRWFHAHGEEKGLSTDGLAKLIGYSGAAVSLVFNGRYPHDPAGLCEEIAKYKKLYEQRQVSRKLPFIETKLSKAIFQVCDVAREFQRVAFIFGDSQIGKTTSLEEYARRNNHGSTIYARMTAGGATGPFMRVLCHALRISDRLSINEMRERIIECFDDRMLLMVDECHLSMYGQMYSNHPLDFIREIYDRKKCGVVLAGTKAFKQEIEHGKLSKMLRQMVRRRVTTLMLPDSPTRDDLNTFAGAYGLPPATGDSRKLESSVIEQEALGMWLTTLRCAAKISGKSKAQMTWEHVIAAHRQLKVLEGAMGEN